MRFATLLAVLALASCASKTAQKSERSVAGALGAGDPYIYLENTNDPRTQKWVQDHNAASKSVIEADSRFGTVAGEARAIVTAQDRIPFPTQHGKMVRNFWQDQNHQRGYVRQTTLQDYLTASPHWETVLDIDALNKQEAKSWVYEGATCLQPDDDLCLISLSDGGRDEVVVREFQISTKQWVKDGFVLPQAKTHVAWIDKDTLFVGTNTGPDSVTDSGYARQIRVWKRGTTLASAPVVFDGLKSDVSESAYKNFRSDSGLMFISQGVNFFEEKVFLYGADGSMKQLPFPTTASFQGDFAGQLMAMLRDDWTVGGRTYKQGSLVSLPLNALGSLDKLEVIYTPDAHSAFEGFARAKNFLMLNILRDVRGELLAVTRDGGKWTTHKMKMPSGGSLNVIDSDDQSDNVFVTYQSFNVPTSLYFGTFSKPLRKVKSLPPKFDARDIVVDQHFAVSNDGTRVPYFLVHKKGMKLDGTNPTLQYGYGGFEISETPMYSGVIGKVWLEKGGVYALANIRGGGEFGPRWHEAALKGNRQRAYDDFAAVSKDLIARKVTSPRRLGIMGGSNGGLLMGVSMTQHPELYNAVVCESALLDMIRYTQMPPGASWIGEYGDPADPAVAAYIMKFSPYQNVRSGVEYPEAFFHISTADDRVQPGHTRKMVARLEEMGHPTLFYENTEGGHGGAADLEQTVHKVAMEFTYLYRKLRD